MFIEKYSVIIYTADGDEISRFDGLNLAEVGNKIKAAIEVGGYILVDEAGAAEERKAEPIILDRLP